MFYFVQPPPAYNSLSTDWYGFSSEMLDTNQETFEGDIIISWKFNLSNSTIKYFTINMIHCFVCMWNKCKWITFLFLFIVWIHIYDSLGNVIYFFRDQLLFDMNFHSDVIVQINEYCTLLTWCIWESCYNIWIKDLHQNWFMLLFIHQNECY